LVSRRKDSANPTIVRVLRTHRGAVRDLTGPRLRDILPGLQRAVLDGEVAVTFRRRGYRGRTTPVTERFRLVGVRDPETGAYHCYLANLSPEQLSAEDVAQLYRARGSMALLFKELKRRSQLDVITRAAPVVVAALVLTALLTLVVSHRILTHLRSLVPAQAARFPPLRWAAVFTAATIRLLPPVLAVAGVTADPCWVMLFMMQEAPDPNLTRNRLLDPWAQPLDG
jgi:putative transposase